MVWRYLRVKDLAVTKGTYGVFMFNDGSLQNRYIDLQRVVSYSNTISGFYTYLSHNVVGDGCVSAWNPTYGLQLNHYVSTWKNSVLWENGNGITLGHAVNFSNNVVRQLSGAAYVGSIQNMQGDYNVFDLVGATATLAGSLYHEAVGLPADLRPRLAQHGGFGRVIGTGLARLPRPERHRSL